MAVLAHSTIDSVRLYRSGAVVRRKATLPTLEGTSARVRLVGLPLTLEDASVRVEASGPSVLYDLAVALDAVTAPPLEPEELERELEALTAREATLAASMRALGEVLGSLDAVGVLPRPDGKEGEPPRDIDVAAQLSWIGFKRTGMEETAAALRAVELERAEVTARRRDVAHRLASSRDRPLKADELKKTVVATLRRPADVSTQGVELALEYFIPGARWAPAYLLRVDPRARRAVLEMRAVVAQSSGEDWSGVDISFSTADVMRHHELPELQSLRIGRAQAPVRKRTWKPPVADPIELFADFARTAGAPGPVPAAESAPADVRQDTATIVGELLSEAEEHYDADELTAGLADMPVPRAAQSAPMAAAPAMFAPQSVAPAKSVSLKARLMPEPTRRASNASARHAPGGGGGAAPPYQQALVVELEVDERVLSYGDLRMPAPEARSGKLRLAGSDELYLERSTTLEVAVSASINETVRTRIAQSKSVLSAALPARHVPPEPVDGFDFVHQGASRIDIPSDGEFHSVPILSFDAAASLRHVVVPRESADAFRFVEIENPIDAPLARGPCDVYIDRDFLMTIDLHTVAPRGRLRAGLGVDQAIKVARNTSYAESTTGLIGGSLQLKQSITIDVTNHRADHADIEVRERAPVVPEREEDIKVEIVAVRPMWHALEPELGDAPVKGAFAWRVPIEPEQRAQLTVTYVIKLPSKLELVGGNRRD